MKKFGGNRRSKDILAECRKRGWPTDTSAYDRGGDCVFFGCEFDGQRLEVVFNTVTGWFVGRRCGETQHFSSDQTHLDGEPWFAALLNFVYLPAPAEVAS